MNKVLLYALKFFTSVQIWNQSAFVYVICREIYLACLGCYTGNAFVHIYFNCYRNNHLLL